MCESTKDVCPFSLTDGRTNYHMKSALLMCLSEFVFCHWESRRNIWYYLAAYRGRGAGWPVKNDAFSVESIVFLWISPAKKNLYLQSRVVQVLYCSCLIVSMIRTDIRDLLKHWKPLRTTYVRVIAVFCAYWKRKINYYFTELYE